VVTGRIPVTASLPSHVLGRTSYLVTKGSYDDCIVLAVFADPDDAQKFADDWNLRHLHTIRFNGDEAVAGEEVPFYPAGQWRPAGPVIDGSTTSYSPALYTASPGEHA
jgi:hypothetical protein